MSDRIKELEREIELVKELLSVYERLHSLKTSPYFPQPYYVPSVWCGDNTYQYPIGKLTWAQTEGKYGK